MIPCKLSVILFILLPFVACVTIVEDFYITQQLLAFFGDVFEDESNESGSEKALTSDERKSAPLLSQLDVKERADHYWTRLGHRSRTSSPPNYGYDYYYGQWSNSDNYNNYQQGRRRRRNVKFLAEKRRKREMDIDRNLKSSSPLVLDQKNTTSEQTTSKIDDRFKRKFNKCCFDTEEAPTKVNENFQHIKSQCVQEVKKCRKSRNTENSTTTSDEYDGMYNLFSCDRLNRWKATITCTMNCMGQKLGMMDSNGELNLNTTKSNIQQIFIHQKWQQEIADDFVDKCAKEVSEKPRTTIDKFGLQCNTRMAEFAYCMWREFFITCPTEKQNKSKQCEKLRLILRNSNDVKSKV